MKKGGNLAQFNLLYGRARGCCLVEKWYRHFSSRAGVAQNHKSATSPVDTGARGPWWTIVEANPSKSWDHRLDEKIPVFPDFNHRATGETLWLQSEPDWGHRKLQVKSFGAPRTYFEPKFDIEAASEDSHRIATYGRGLQVETWRNTSEAVEGLEHLLRQRCQVPIPLFYRVLKRCIAQKDLVLGRHVHALTQKSGYKSNTFLANHLIRMYTSHGRLQEAMQVFLNVAAPDCFMWSSIIRAHAELGQPMQAIKLYGEMRQTAVKPDNHVFMEVLKACASVADLDSGKQVHADILQSPIEPDAYVGNCLVDMYAKCGSVGDARKVFDSLDIRDVVTWNAMITGYAHHGLGHEALTLYASMQHEAADHVTYVSLLKACGSVRALQQGKQLHLQIQKRGLESDVVIGNCLVDMYAKCGSLEDAQRVFDRLPTRDVMTWHAMINGYARDGHAQEALRLFASIQQGDMNSADEGTFVSLLKACASVGALHQGRQLHTEIQKRGLEADVVIGSCLVDMYAKCGSMKNAHKVFENLPTRDVVTWTAMINGYGQCNDGRKAIQCFHEMQRHGVEPDEATFICLLVACSHDGLVDEGQQYFRMMVEKHGIKPNVQHYNCMVDLLGRSGRLDQAESMLLTMPCERTLAGWMSLLTACRGHGDVERGRRCFDRLIELEPQHAAPYVLLANVYAEAGRWTDVVMIERMRKAAGASKKPARASIEVNSNVQTFIVGEERSDISSKLKSVNARLEDDASHIPHTDLVLKPAYDGDKDALCGHAEKLALAYGLLNTPDGTTLLVTKNLRMCSDCHSGTKIMSKIEKRAIIVRDAHRVHHFVDGFCSCRDRH